MIQKIKNVIVAVFGYNSEHRYFNVANIVFIMILILGSFASLFHVREFWFITNTPFWATALAISTGLGIIGSMMATRFTGWAYASFILIMLMELMGNVFSAFLHIDVTGIGFLAFKELFEPLFQMIYFVDEGETISDITYKRWVAGITGSFIPILVTIMFHIWLKITEAFKKITTAKIATPVTPVTTVIPAAPSTATPVAPSTPTITTSGTPIVISSGSTITPSGSTTPISGTTVSISGTTEEEEDKKKAHNNLLTPLKNLLKMITKRT